MENIEELGLKEQRRTVLRAVRELKTHLTTNEVFEAAKQIFAGHFVCDLLQLL